MAVTEAGSTTRANVTGAKHSSRRPGKTNPRRKRARRTPDRDFIEMRLDSARRAFRSDAEMAEALGVNRAQLSRWREGQVPERENADRLAGLDVVVQLLSGYLSETSIPKWLNGINAHLDDRRPIALLRAGQLAEVIAAIEAMKSGAYA